MEKMNPLLSQEKIHQSEELRQKNRKDAQVMEDLDFVLDRIGKQNIKNLAERRDELSEKLRKQILELKKIGYEKAIIINARYQFAENILTHLSYKLDSLDKLKIINQNRSERIGRHSSEYEIDPEAFYSDFDSKNSGAFEEMEDLIGDQRRVVEALQRLTISDDEFGGEYIGVLDRASNELNQLESEKDNIILSKAKEVLAGLPFSEKLIIEIDNIIKKTEYIDEEERDILEENVDWEMIPADKLNSHRLAARKTGKEGGLWSMMNIERIEYIESLNPNKMYASKNSVSMRDYIAYEFDNCVVIASPFSRNAVYVIPNSNNWQDLSKKGKKELRFREALRFENVTGWDECLREIIDNKIELIIDEKSVFIEKGWDSELESVKEMVRNKIFIKNPNLEEFIKEGKIEEAKKVLLNIRYPDLWEMKVGGALRRFNNKKKDMFMDCFPEVELSEKDFISIDHKFKWDSSEVTIENVRMAIFENFPEIKEAIDSNDLDSAGDFLVMLTDEDFFEAGLRVVAQGKNEFFTSRKKALFGSFPEIKNLDKKWIAVSKNIVYKNKKDKFSAWGNKLRNAILEEIGDIKELLENGENEKVKLIIIKTIVNEGVYNFIRRILPSIYGVKGIGGHEEQLALAFPEFEWSNFKVKKSGVKN